jgi:hypothetical protein
VAFLLLFPDRHQEGQSVFQKVYLNHCPLSGLCLLFVCSVELASHLDLRYLCLVNSLNEIGHRVGLPQS